MTRLGPETVVRIRVDYRDHWLTVVCPGCDRRQEERVAAVMMVVRVRCANCGHAGQLEPPAIAAACARLLPDLDTAAGDAMDERVAALIRGWTRLPGVRELLDHAGVDLGAGAALRLVPVVLRGLLGAGTGGPS